MAHLSIEEVLYHLELSKYEDTFRQQEVTWDVFPFLNEKDLQRLGLPVGPCKKIQRYIEGRWPLEEFATPVFSPRGDVSPPPLIVPPSLNVPPDPSSTASSLLNDSNAPNNTPASTLNNPPKSPKITPLSPAATSPTSPTPTSPTPGEYSDVLLQKFKKEYPEFRDHVQSKMREYQGFKDNVFGKMKELKETMDMLNIRLTTLEQALAKHYHPF